MSIYLLTCVSIVCFLYYFTRNFNYWKARNIKGPTPIPFFGNFIDVFFRRKHVGTWYIDHYNQYPDEKVVSLYRMTSPTLLIRDLDIVKQVLIKNFDSFPDRGLHYSKKKLGDNLFHADVTVMKIFRQHLTSVFTSGKLKANFEVLASGADKFVRYLDNATLKESEINMLPAFRKFGIDSTTMAQFGIDVDPYNDGSYICDLLDAAIQKPNYLLELDLLFPGILLKYDLSAFPAIIAKFSEQLFKIGSKLEADSKTNPIRVMEVLMGLRRQGYVSSRKIAEGEKELWMEVTDDILVAQVFEFYFAGYSNNSLLGIYAMYQLAKNPDVQEKLIQEIDDILRKHGGKFSYEALKEMKYLHMVFDETMRMNPISSSVSRCAGRDIQLDGTDFVIKKDTMVSISPYGIHHDEKYFPEPEVFKPERFSPENSKGRHPCAMMSFGNGPRRCPGTRFAQLQFEIGMVKVFSKFRVECSKNTVDKIMFSPMRLLLTPINDIYLRLVRRDTL